MPWHKVDNYKWIFGSVRWELTPAERSVWADLLALSGLSERGGYIEFSEGKGFPKEALAQILVVPMELLDTTVDKCVAEGRLQCLENDVLLITNWDRYQFIPEGKSQGEKRERKRKKDEALREEKEHLQAAAGHHEKAERLGVE